LKLWGVAEKVSLVETFKFEHSVTAAAFYHGSFQNQSFYSLCSYLIAIGLENGSIFLLLFAVNEEGKVNVVFKDELAPSETHSKTVTYLDWRPGPKELTLASCSEDCSVRLFSIEMK
jgi:WD40 repeat protein